MVDFLEVPALRENGLFGVPKSSVEDPLTRMITDGESTNWFTKRLPKVRLPNPESLSRLPRWCKKAAALDIHSFYNCLKLPAGWRKYFGLPKIRASEVGGPENVWWYPVNATLPMGWTGSVWLGQLVHEALFKQAIMSLGEEYRDLHFVNLRDAEAVKAAEFLPHDRVVFYSIYIDDLNLFGIRGEVLDVILGHCVEIYATQGFPVKPSKTTWATSALRVLGVWLDLESGLVKPVPKLLHYLYHTLPAIPYWVKSCGACCCGARL
jgi:hypothetical protein